MSVTLYKTKSKKLPGSSYGEVYGIAYRYYKELIRGTKRRPYIKSAYFQKQKIFFDYFWEHLRQKNPRERFRRLKYFICAVELIQKTKRDPISEDNPHKTGELLHRFAGLTKENELFYVQIKEDKRTGEKYFMSCFPEK